MLYTGPVVLSEIISTSAYNHFLSLSLAIHILSSPKYFLKFNSYANSLLKLVVEIFPKIYGISTVSYNVHGLLHIAEDAKRHGPLDSYSCYAFESRIKWLKRMIHTQNMPLQQCHNRICEKIEFETSKIIITNKQNSIILSKPSPINTRHYMEASFPKFTITANKKSDNCVLLHSNTVLKICYFEEDVDGHLKYAVGHTFVDVQPLNNESTLKQFHMLIGNFDNVLIKHLCADIICKMCCFPYELKGAQFFVCPINHTL